MTDPRSLSARPPSPGVVVGVRRRRQRAGAAHPGAERAEARELRVCRGANLRRTRTYAELGGGGEGGEGGATAERVAGGKTLDWACTRGN